MTRDIVPVGFDGSADLGIISAPITAEEPQVMHCSNDKLVLCTPVGHPLAMASREIAFADTLDYPHVSLHEGSTLHAFLTDLVRDQRRKLQIRIQVRSFEAMCRMIEAGVGIGVVPLSAALRHSKTMQIEISELADAWAIRERAVIVRDIDGLPGCARDLIDELIKVAQAAGGS